MGARGNLRCRVVSSPHCNGGHEPGWPTSEFRGVGANVACSLDKWRSSSGGSHLYGVGPHLQYSFLIKLASLRPIFFSGGTQASPIFNPPTYWVETYQPRPSERSWTEKLSQRKRLALSVTGLCMPAGM